jgi:hypothetical protein
LKLAELEANGVDVTEVYFYDHGIAEIDEYGIIGDVIGLQFGTDELMREGDRADGGSNLEVFCQIIDIFLPEDCTINFRHCFTAKGVNDEEEGSMLEDLASWSNRSVTGAIGAVTHSGPYSATGEPNPDGPDYGICGGLWKASPGDSGIMTEMIWSPYRSDYPDIRYRWEPLPPQPY